MLQGGDCKKQKIIFLRARETFTQKKFSRKISQRRDARNPRATCRSSDAAGCRENFFRALLADFLRPAGAGSLPEPGGPGCEDAIPRDFPGRAPVQRRLTAKAVPRSRLQ